MSRRWAAAVLWLVALCLVAVACGDGDAAETTVAASGADIELGSGDVPDTVPDSFPFPDGSVISSTLVNRDTGFTEMIVRMPMPLGVAVQFYQTSLTLAEWEVVESAAQGDTGWDMVATGEGLVVTIDFRVARPDVTEAVFTFEPE